MISFVIERVGVQIRPYASSLVTYLPALWEESKDHNMLKCAILTTLIHLVQVLVCTNLLSFDCNKSSLPVSYRLETVSWDKPVLHYMDEASLVTAVFQLSLIIIN